MMVIRRPITKSKPQSRYTLRISRLTIDKLGVKLYDKASAVVAELIANGYDADAEKVRVTIPLATQLASHSNGRMVDSGYEILVEDDGHGMTPEEAQKFYLMVGRDRRARATGGSTSRLKNRPVMGRKGIGKLAPFGICRRIEVRSAGGPETSKGFHVTHFHMDFDDIMADTDESVVLASGADDGTWDAKSGTKIRLTKFLPKRVPDKETFLRQLAMRFTVARPDFKILVRDSRTGSNRWARVDPLKIPLVESTKLDLRDYPVIDDDGKQLAVTGWLAMAEHAYKYEETSGVRIYARGKIIGVTRDFNQPAGFTGEFTMRSYLVGEVHAEWLDLDRGEDLIRTDRQDILWDSDYGQLLRAWGADLIKRIASASREPRRKRVRDQFIRVADFEARAEKRFRGKKDVLRVAMDLAQKLGGFAAEDELKDEVYVNDLSDIILSVAPHQALIEAFKEFSARFDNGSADVDDMLEIFDKAQIAELASYAQIAQHRVRVIDQLREIIDGTLDEDHFQALIADAPWLVEPTWSVISKNQSLKSFKDAFERFYKREYDETVLLAIENEKKRPDFTLVSHDGRLHIVEIKKARHAFDDSDFERLNNYVIAFQEFFKQNQVLTAAFHRGFVIDLVADGENVKKGVARTAWASLKKEGIVVRQSWEDFLARTKRMHEEFLNVRDAAASPTKAKRS